MSSPRNIRKKTKLSFHKEIITEEQKVNVNHLIRSLPFDTKTRLCTIRKQALFNTLSSTQAHVRKTYSLNKLLEIAKETFGYNDKLELINKRLSTFQNIYKRYYNNLELRLQGPGIPVSRCVNEDCPYTMETLTDIPKTNIFTWKDDKIYGCDFQSLYTLFSKHMDRQGILYECKENEYRTFIEEYVKLSHSLNTRRLSRSRLGPIINPFTRAPFPGEAFGRILDIGKRKGLLSKEPRNQRIRRRPTTRRPTRDQEVLNVEEETGQPVTSRTNVIELSNEVSEHLRSLEFYTPDTILTDIIRPIFMYSQTTSPAPPLNHSHSMRVLEYITQSCIPVLEHLADHFSSSLIRVNINRRNPHYEFYRSFRQGYCIRALHSHNRSIQDMIHSSDTLHRHVTTRIRRYARLFLRAWTEVFGLLNSLLTSVNINVDDKKSIAIFIIISLAQTGFLNEGFEWAIGI